jgi:hypothetical protein
MLGDKTQRNERAAKKSQYRYHVGTLGGGFTLCGLETYGIVWDQPAHWLKNETSSSYSGSLPRCGDCGTHEDFALMFLGDLP